MTDSRRAIVVTGAATGIGAACALRLDRNGYTVFAGVLTDEEGAMLRQRASSRLRTVTFDVTDREAIAHAVQEIERELADGRLYGLVNNAGIVVSGPLEYLPLDELRRQFEVNVIGQIAVTQAFLPLLRRGQGRIITIGSVAGRVATAISGPYCASKHAVEALMTALRMELRPWNLPVSLIEPGAVATPIWDRSIAATRGLMERLPPQARDRYGIAVEAMCALTARAGQHGLPPERVARAVEHALSDRKPRPRYLVGRNAWRAEFVRLLPERLRENILLALTRNAAVAPDQEPSASIASSEAG